MPSAEFVVREALGDLAVDDQRLIDGLAWLNSRYAEFANRRLRQLRRVGTFNVPGVVTAGIASIVRGSDTVGGDAVSQAAWDALTEGGPSGWYFQARTAWYPVIHYERDGILVLDRPYAEDDSSSSSYRLVKRYTTLSEPAAFLGTFAHARLRRPLRTVAVSDLNSMQPERQYTSAGPWFIAPAGHEDGKPVVEIYPYSMQSEQIQYVYWAPPTMFQLDDELPPEINYHYLKEGMMIDVFRYKMVIAANTGKETLAALWRNEYRAQEVRWMEQYIPELVKADGSPEDLVLMLGGSNRLRGDIRTAHDEVYARGNRP